MRTRFCFTALSRMVFVGMLTVVTGGSNLFPLAAATLNTATIRLGSSTSTTVCGATVTYSATVTSTTSQTVTWFVDGVAKGNSTVGVLTPNGDQTHVLYTAPAVSGTHVISAVATNAAGAKVSRSTTLTVKAATSSVVAPSITTQPRSVSVTAGQSASFSVTATSSVAMNYQWRKNGTAISGATSASYSTPATTTSDSGATFTVAVTNAAGSTLSSSAALTVAPSTATNITSVYLNDLSVSAGSSGQVVSKPVPTSAQATDFAWSTSAGTATSPGTVGGSSLNGTVSASGLYTAPAGAAVKTKAYRVWAVSKANSAVKDFCYVTIASATPPATVAPSITTQPRSVAVTVGQTATFSVTATSSVAMNYQWRKNGTAISGATSASYSTPATTTSDNGATFTVAVTNTAGSVVSTAAALTVNASTLAIQSFSANPATVVAGQGSILTWAGSGATQLSISPSVGDVTGLTTKNVSPTATTTYTLTARNAAGQTVTASTTVTMTSTPSAPTLTTQPKSVAVTAGQTATFTVTAASTASLTYQWRKNGAAISGATSASYSTPATSTSDNGAQFTVLVANTSNSVTSSAATLTVNTTQQKWYGFGSKTTGGSGKTVVHVTNRNDTGAGSLRAAVAGGNHYIVFDVGGTIALASALYVQSNTTIDGSTAPSPGITLTGHSICLTSVNNIIITNLRHRGGWDGNGGGGGDADNISVFSGCYNIVLDHLSLSGSYDENLGIFNSNHDITIQNCIIGHGNPAGEKLGSMAGKYGLRVTYYHNLFHVAYYRNPAIGYDIDGGTGQIAPSIVGDVVNNVVWKYPTYGTTVYHGGKANVVGNYYYTAAYPGASNRAVNVDSDSGGVAFSSGNYSKDGSSIYGNTSTPFAVAEYAQIAATSAIDAANYVKDNAGCRVGGMDALDSSIINDVNP